MPAPFPPHPTHLSRPGLAVRPFLPNIIALVEHVKIKARIMMPGHVMGRVRLAARNGSRWDLSAVSRHPWLGLWASIWHSAVISLLDIPAWSGEPGQSAGPVSKLASPPPPSHTVHTACRVNMQSIPPLYRSLCFPRRFCIPVGATCKLTVTECMLFQCCCWILLSSLVGLSPAAVCPGFRPLVSERRSWLAAVVLMQLERHPLTK